MDWGEVLTKITLAFISATMPVLLGLLVAWLRPVIRNFEDKIATQLGDEQWRFTKSLVLTFVQAAEQRGVWDDLLKEGAKKKEWVKDQLAAVFTSYGLDIDWDEIDAAIEQAVHGMNWANGKNGS